MGKIIYFVGDGRGKVKIGVSRSMSSRMPPFVVIMATMKKIFGRG